MLGSRYLVVCPIGAGSVGQVYQGRVLGGQHERVAIKIINLSSQANRSDARSGAERVFHEIRALLQLRSSHILRFRDYLDLGDGHVALITELVEGQSLESLLESLGHLPPLRALELARQVAVGLAEAHREGVVHRDIKPDNIIVQQLSGGDDFVKIIDFGISYLDKDARVTRGFLGTPLYASPEQFAGQRGDARSDIYALGITLFEALCGSPPFLSDSILGLMRQHASQALPLLASQRPELAVMPPELDRLLARMMAKTPGDRPSCMEEVVEGLDRILVKLAPVPTTTPAGNVARTRRGRPEIFESGHFFTRSETSHSGIFRRAGTDPDVAGPPRHRTGPLPQLRDRGEPLSALSNHHAVQLGGDGRTIQAASLDGGPWREVWRAAGAVTALALREHRLFVGLGDGAVQSLDLRKPELVHDILRLEHGGVTAVCADNSSTRLLVASSAQELLLWQLLPRPYAQTIPCAEVPIALCSDGAGTTFAAAFTSGTLSIFGFEGRSLEMLGQVLPPARPCQMAMSADGHVLTATLDDQRLWLYEPIIGQQIALLKLATAPPAALFFAASTSLCGLCPGGDVPRLWKFDS